MENAKACPESLLNMEYVLNKTNNSRPTSTPRSGPISSYCPHYNAICFIVYFVVLARHPNAVFDVPPSK